MTKLLLGYDLPGLGRLYSPDQKSLPVLATPLRRHLNTITDFAFNGGITVEPKDLQASPAKKMWLVDMTTKLRADTFFQSVYEKAAICGECLIGFYPSMNRFTGQTDGYWEWLVFEPANVISPLVKGMGSYKAKEVYRDKDDRVMEVVWVFDRFGVTKYRPRLEGSIQDLALDWQVDFAYPVPPAYVFQNTPDSEPEFDKAALAMALEITLQHMGIAENNLYFSNQLIESLQPALVMRAIKSRTKVFQGGADGKPSTFAIDLKEVPASAQGHITKLAENLGHHLGTPLMELNMRSDISSLAMKMANMTAIKTAGRKWEWYSSQLSEVFENLLVMTAYQGILADVQLSVPRTWQVKISQNSEPFPLTPSEKQIMATLAKQLIDLGVDPKVVLSTEYYKSHTRETVSELEAPEGFAKKMEAPAVENKPQDPAISKP